jgi:hypothetical protein
MTEQDNTEPQMKLALEASPEPTEEELLFIGVGT